MSTAKQTNAAESRGPATHTQNPKLESTVAEPHYNQLRQHYQSAWAPANPYLADKVDDLVAYRWELNRLRDVRRQFLANALFDTATMHDTHGLSLVAQTELHAAEADGTLERLDLRIRRCNLEISRIERDILRAARHLKTFAQPHQNQPEQNPTAWAEETFDIALDPHQADILEAPTGLTLVNTARYAGKTTALALRVLHQAQQDAARPIACLSPNGELEAKIAELATAAGQPRPTITNRPAPDTKLLVIDDATELTHLPEIKNNITVIAAATPNGASGPFYKLWRQPGTNKIAAPAAHCEIIGESLLELARTTLTSKQFRQEFQCEFLPAPEPRCRLLPLAQ